MGWIVLSPAQGSIPTWFEKLPKAPPGVRLAVGCSGKFINEKRAKAAAIESAQKNMAKQISIRLIFDLEELADGRLRLLNPSFKQYYEETDLRTVKNNYSVVDSLITVEGYYVLLAYPKSDNLRLDPTRENDWGPRPDWINNLPTERGYVYGVGMAAKYSNWLRAWYDADEFARFDVGKNIQISTESIHTSKRDNRTTVESVILKQSYDLTLKGATIVARWFDAQAGAYYSLCRAPRQ